MKRRDFLHATVVTLGVLLTNEGCSSDNQAPSAGAPAPSCTDEPGELYFPQSVASGDPKPDSVILWTRVEDASAPGVDLELALEVALDEQFTQQFQIDGQPSTTVKAEAAFDHCAKVRLTGLAPATFYYYRFRYQVGDKCYVSRVGRTKTAPAAGADVPVKFAFVSCQDYVGRYYNALLSLATHDDLDFVVHLGDYVYETTGDPSFQETSGRKLTFTDTAGAIALQASDGQTFYAAKSLSNYRQLYKTYRGDRALQAMHERFPMIATWDDHEFSDDCHGATATYFDGAKDETDVDRRKHANQAWFEYMPVDFPGKPDFRYDPSVTYPQDISIYRDFTFGKHVHLVMTDLRTYRADHLVPEEAFPGQVVFDQATLQAALGAVPDAARPYVDVAQFQGGAYQPVLTAAAAGQGYDAAAVTGLLSVAWINSIVSKIADPIGPIDATDPSLERGISWIDMGKSGYHTSIGSRYLVVKDTFDIYAKLTYAAAPEREQVMGPDQEAWFLGVMQSATETWKIWGNEYCLIPLQIDVTTYPVPDALKHTFYLDCDDWDGFRDKRSALIDTLSTLDNVVAVSGDIHAFYAGTPTANGDASKKLVELVGSSVSSGTFKSELNSQVQSDPVLSSIPLAAALASQIDSLLTSATAKTNPHLGFADSGKNGYVIVEAGAGELVATYYMIADTEVTTDYTGKESELEAKVQTEKFRAVAGERELYRDFDGTWKRWDMQSMTWV